MSGVQIPPPRLMTNNGVYITRLSAWAPGINSNTEWNEWANDKRDISSSNKGPEISFTEPMFRRRLSQISKMTIQVIYDLKPLKENIKIFFLSFRGEISKQFQVNVELIKENSISPAAFSLSVFNAPVALATMALGLKGGYTAIYPGKNSFADGIIAATAALNCTAEEELVFVYADEEVPAEYNCFFDKNPVAVAFGLYFSKTPHPGSIALSVIDRLETPLGFLKKLLKIRNP